MDNLAIYIAIFVLSFIVGSFVWFAFRNWRHVPGKDESFYRNGAGGPTISHDAAMWVFPIVHIFTRVSHEVVQFKLQPHEYLCADRKYLTMKVVFRVRVGGDTDSVRRAVLSQGNDYNPLAITGLIEDRLLGTVRAEVANLESADLVGKSSVLEHAFSLNFDPIDLKRIGLTIVSLDISNICDTGRVWAPTGT